MSIYTFCKSQFTNTCQYYTVFVKSRDIATKLAETTQVLYFTVKPDVHEIPNLTIVLISEKKEKEKATIHPKELYRILDISYAFVSKYPSSVIVIDAFDILLKYYNIDAILSVIYQIITLAKTKDAKLILFLKKSLLTQEQYYYLLSRASEQPLAQILESLSSPIRQNIIHLLYKNKKMTFSKLLELLKISSALLSFHIRNLVLSELITTDEYNHYTLTEKGKIVADSLMLLMQHIVTDRYSNVIILEP